MENSTTYYRKRAFNYILFLSCFHLCFFIQLCQATILTVDNNYPKIGQFATLQEAHDAAIAGDTICVYPSLVNYSAIKTVKKIHFLGAGFQASQDGLRATLLDGLFEFSSVSGGSSLTGFGGDFNVVVAANNISIERNKVKSIKVQTGHLGTIITQNFINSDGDFFLIDIESENEAYISNNIIKNHSLWYGPNGNNSNNGKGIRANQTTNTTIILNNVVDLANVPYSFDVVAIDIGSSNTTASNNIILIGSIIGTQSEFSNNLINPDIESVFIDFRQNNYKLKSASPAFGTGENGIDMGIYGGDAPFVDGGYPDIPVIYFLDVPLNANQKHGLNVTIKAKSNQ